MWPRWFSEYLPAVVVASAAITAVAKLPPFLIAASATLIRPDLPLTESRVGLIVACFFAMTAVASLGAGRLYGRYDTRRLLVVAVLTSGVAMLLAAAVTRWWHLALLLLVCGASNGLAEPGTNQALAVHVRPGRQGLSFGIKQAAAPLTTLLSGVGVSVLGLRLGWRGLLVVGGLVALAVYLAIPRELTGRSDRGRVSGRRRSAAMFFLAASFGLGTGAATGIASFMVDSGLRVGLDLQVAGLVLACSSIGTILVRILIGWLADRRQRRLLLHVAAMLGLGGCGVVLMASGQPVLFAVGAVLGLSFGWGWTGLFNFTIARRNPRDAAGATGVILTGAAVGAAGGPLALGMLLERIPHAGAWLVVASWLLLAAGVATLGRWMLLRDASP